MNVADYYLHGKPKVGKWRDMHVRMTGSIVQAYEQLFWKMWGKETGEKKTPSNSPFRGRTSGEESLPIEGEVWRGSGQCLMVKGQCSMLHEAFGDGEEP